MGVCLVNTPYIALMQFGDILGKFTEYFNIYVPDVIS